MSDVAELDDIAARALCSVILEHTADCLADGGAKAADALKALEADTGLVLDVCAAILQATSWLAGTGGIEAAAIFAASVAFQPEDDEAAESAAENPVEAIEADSGVPVAETSPEAVTGDPEGQSGDVEESAPVVDPGELEDFIRQAQEAAAKAMADLGIEEAAGDAAP